MKKPILCDVDGVICGFIEQCLKIANESGKCDKTWLHEEMAGDIREMPLWHQCGLETEWLREGFCENLPILPGAQEFIESLRKLDRQIIFVTSPPRDSKTWPYERRRWLEKNFGAKRTEVIFAVDKKYVDGFVLIDDHEGNILGWQKYNEKPAILVGQPWNLKIVMDDLKYYPGRRDANINDPIYHEHKFEALSSLYRAGRYIEITSKIKQWSANSFDRAYHDR